MRAGRASFAAIAAVLMGMAGPALAQSSGGTPTPTPAPMPPPLPAPPTTFQDFEQRNSLDASRMLTGGSGYREQYTKSLGFTDCVQRVTPKRLERFLRQPIGSSAERRAASALLRSAPGCSSRSFVVSVRFLRGAASETILQNYASPDIDRAGTLDSERIERFMAYNPAISDRNDPDVRALARYTQCQVMVAPGLARKLILADHGSDEEKALREQIASVTGMCGTMEAKNDLAAVTYRSYLAEALYHWTRSGEFARDV
ncbi:hypothetical protein [Paraurantiacibacter namhicola]|uniref:Uncharacterized protein n=1 Tax=Paraurantiacibacter namhicola TaxID=645517 RepID=A0A1C7D9H3_9SPHN|nr:hypothetical protein [Paraurantiacibacter namhicola]ANU08098.1 hypothetical protein A6F65_01803 [Paraurantiacibacter namhicola]